MSNLDDDFAALGIKRPSVPNGGIDADFASLGIKRPNAPTNPTGPAVPAKSNWEQAADEMGPVRAGLARAGGATLDAINGLKGLIGLGDDAATVADRNAANAGLQASHPVAATAGNLAAQAAMMYAGGTALKGLGAAAGAANLGRAAQALDTAGSAVAAPTSLARAVGGGAGYNAATTAGDLKDRLIAGAEGGAGGAAGYGIGKGIGAAAGAVVDKTKQLVGNSSLNPAQVEQAVRNAMSSQGAGGSAAGATFDSLPAQAQQAVLQMGKEALESGNAINPEMAQRLADFKRLGIDPLKAWVTRNPQDMLQAHSLQGVNDAVTQRYAGADSVLTGKLRQAAPDISDYAAGDALRNVVAGKDAALKNNADALYQQVRDAGGADVPLDGASFAKNVSSALTKNLQAVSRDGQLQSDRVPGAVVSWINDIGSGKVPLTFGEAVQKLQTINDIMYNSSDKATINALKPVKNGLMDALSTAHTNPMVSNADQAAAGQLTGLYDQARAAAAQRFKFQESSPVVEAITSGKFTPEKLPDMMRSLKVDDLGAMAKTDAQYGTDTLAKMRDAASIYLRDAATLQAETGGKFSQSGLRRAMDNIGPEKGQMLFGDKWGEYQAMLRAGGNMINQQAGVVMNNSGTGQYIANMLKKVPIPGMPSGVNLALTAADKIAGANAAQAQLAGQVYRPKGLLDFAGDRMAQPGGLGGLLGYYGAEGGVASAR